MNNSIFHFVNIEDTLVKKEDISVPLPSENLEDVLKLPTTQDLDREQLEIAFEKSSKGKYYRLDRVVFAEPVETGNIEDSGIQDVDEIVAIDNVMVKKRPGKRNKYFIDIKDGCLDCPLSNCSQTFATKALLKAHVRKVHCATTKFMCEECGAGFTARYLLRRHSVVHAGGKVQCTECGKSLSPRTNLSVHMKTHGSSRDHGCAACGKRFMRRATLLRHEKYVHKRGDIACGICDKRFTSQAQWRHHRASHAAETCGKVIGNSLKH